MGYYYYPFGLTMTGISDRALQFGKVNKYRFQGQEEQSKEFSDGSGLDMYEFKYRFDDDQIGRFWSVDPLASKYPYNSVYAFSEDKVTGDVELEGLESISANIVSSQIFYPSVVSNPAEMQKIAPIATKVGIMAAIVLEPMVGIPLAISYLSGVPVNPSPQAMAEPIVQDATAIAPTTTDAVAPTEGTSANPMDLFIDANQHPESAQHLNEAQAANNGEPITGVVDRPGSGPRRQSNLKGITTEAGKDRDEVPPAVIKSDVSTSVKLIPSGDNRGAGASIGNQLRNVQDGTRVVLKVIPIIKPPN